MPNLYGFNYSTKNYNGLICNFLTSAFKSREIRLLSDGLEQRAMCNAEAKNNLGLQIEYIPDEKLHRVISNKYNIITFAETCAIVVDEILGGKTSVIIKGIDKPVRVDKDHFDRKILFNNIKYTAKKMIG